jgi:hypothetical protein
MYLAFNSCENSIAALTKTLEEAKEYKTIAGGANHILCLNGGRDTAKAWVSYAYPDRAPQWFETLQKHLSPEVLAIASKILARLMDAEMLV